MYLSKSSNGNQLKVFGFGSGDGIKLVIPLAQSMVNLENLNLACITIKAVSDLSTKLFFQTIGA